jgi:hypothetical protein
MASAADSESAKRSERIITVIIGRRATVVRRSNSDR